MGKDNHKGPDFLIPIPYVTEDEKDSEASNGKPPPVKLLLDAAGKAIYNPTVQVQPIFNGGTTEQFFKWFQSLNSLLEGQPVGEHFRLALQALQGTEKALFTEINGSRKPEASGSCNNFGRSCRSTMV
jgi:hypothetical protein